MPSSASSTAGGLRQLARQRVLEGDACELCGAPIGEPHQHLAEPATRRMVCCCRACAVLFSRQADTRYRLVPDTVRALPGFAMPDEVWNSLAIPVDMAYFFRSTAAGRMVALYPSPSGATESQLTLAAWQELEAANPELRDLQADVEGLLVNRIGERRDHYLAPIDRFYELVGVLRIGWRGLSGGTEVWRDINAYFARLRALAVEVRGGA